MCIRDRSQASLTKNIFNIANVSNFRVDIEGLQKPGFSVRLCQQKSRYIKCVQKVWVYEEVQYFSIVREYEVIKQ